MSLLILHKKNESRRRHLARAREYARQHGERLVLAMTDPTWEADFADQVVIADIRSVEQTLAVAGELAGDGDPISAVASFAEAAVPTVATLAVELDLPAVSERTAYLARDKFAMRQAFAAAGVPQPGFALARTLREARVAARRTGFPVVLKPVLGTGSMYVRSVADEAELDDIFALLLQRAWDSFTGDPLYQQARREHDGALLIEEFVPGPEVCVDSLVVDGETHVIAIHDKPLPTGPTFEEVYACTPTRLPGEVAARVGEATKAVHAALGITTGATHVEFRLRGGAEPVVLEAAARMGGGPVYRSVLLSTGVDLVAAALDLASGRRPDPSWRHAPRPVGFWNMFPERPGQFTRVQGLEEVNADSQVDEIAIYRQLGDYLAMPPATIQGHGHLIFTVDTVEQLDDAFERYRKTVRLETRAG
jgi:biotin carboxylase